MFYQLFEACDLVRPKMPLEIIHRLGARGALVFQSRSWTSLNPLRSHDAALPEFECFASLIVRWITDHLRHGHVHEVLCLQHHTALHVGAAIL